MLRVSFVAMAVVLAAPVYADGMVDRERFMIGDADAFEDDYDEEFDKATKEEYKAKRGEKKEGSMQEKEWELWEPVLDRDPFWSGPIQHESGDHFMALNTTNPMEAAATLDKWHFFIKLSANVFRQQFDDTDGGEDVKFHSQLNFGIVEGRIGLPARFEFGIKYIYGENLERGKNDLFWFEGRTQVIRSDERDDGSKAIEANLKWNLYKHEDGISGFAINVKYKEPLSIRSNFLDTMSREGGANLAISIKWGITSFHFNLGAIYTRGSTRLLFHEAPESLTDTDVDRVELDGYFITSGLAFTIQIFEFLMAIAQVEGHTNAWDRELEETYNEEITGTGLIGLRVRLGPVVMEGGLGRRFTEHAAEVTGVGAIGIKF